MTGAPEASEDARTAFHRELRQATRSTSIPAGALILVAFLGWALLDRALEPANAASFLAVRVVAEGAVAVALLSIVLGWVRGRALELASFAMFLFVQVAIAWMLPRVEHSFEAYLLGFSLALYGSGIVVAWRWQLTALLALVSLAALAVFELVHPSILNARSATIAGFYLGTATLVAVIAQYLRHQAAWREFRIRGALEEEQRQREALVQDLARLSREDELTGLVNRRGWQDGLQAAFDTCRQRGSALAVVLCDLDHFKSINDRHGHATGDEVLRRIASMLEVAVRSTDTVARLGGDEFGVICPRADRATAASVAVRIVEGMRALGLSDLGLGPMTFSVGAALLAGGDLAPDALVQRADAEMYRAKETRDAAWVSGVRYEVPGPRPLRTVP